MTFALVALGLGETDIKGPKQMDSIGPGAAYREAKVLPGPGANHMNSTIFPGPVKWASEGLTFHGRFFSFRDSAKVIAQDWKKSLKVFGPKPVKTLEKFSFEDFPEHLRSSHCEFPAIL